MRRICNPNLCCMIRPNVEVTCFASPQLLPGAECNVFQLNSITGLCRVHAVFELWLVDVCVLRSGTGGSMSVRRPLTG